MCEILSTAGFLSGLLHGFIAVFVLVADLFFTVEVYDHCQQSWFYDFGFLIGMVFLVNIWDELGVLVLLVIAILGIIAAIFKPVLMVVGFALVIILVASFWQKFQAWSLKQPKNS